MENLFDLKHDRSEYKEYIPFTSSQWNKKAYQTKLQNISKVIKQLNAEVIALQEVESLVALQELKQMLTIYPYHAFAKNKKSAVGLAILSQYPITEHEIIRFNTKVNRPIQKVNLQIQNRELIVFNNHWASKRNKESQRVNFALKLQEELKQLSSQKDYILLGDFNSNYNEFETLPYEKRLNDTQGFTGINHVLHTVIDENIITKENILKQNKKVHYNLWYETQYDNRFSAKFRGSNTTPDNILLSKGLFDKVNFSYVNNSFQVFKPHYLYDKGKIKRWQLSKKRVHRSRGYSDHLPILATFTLSPYKVKKKPPTSTINTLYELESLHKPLELSKVLVTYKAKNHAIIKQPNQRSIFLYNCAEKLKEGFYYDLTVKKIKTYQGLKEILSIDNVKTLNFEKEYRQEYINGNEINLNHNTNQNEMIKQLEGQYKKGYLHYNGNKKIRLYSKNRTLLPKNGENITIMSGHLGYFKNQAQIIIYRASDIKVNF